MPPSNSRPCFLGIRRVAASQNHIGIAFEASDGFMFLDLQWHHILRCKSWDALLDCRSVRVDLVGIDPERLKTLAALCRLIHSRHEKEGLPYGFSIGAHFGRNGELEAPANFDGFTCASFILAIFESEGLNIVDHQRWPNDEADLDWQLSVISSLREHGHVAQADALNAALPATRYKPQHVAAAASLFPPPQSRISCDSRAQQYDQAAVRLTLS